MGIGEGVTGLVVGRFLAPLIAMGLIGVAPVHAQTAGSMLYGPISFRLPSSRPFEGRRNFSAPERAAGAYMMRVEVQPASGLTQLSVSLNEAPVVTLADFAGGVTRVDRPVNVLAQNALEYQLGGERGTAFTVSILTLQMPKPVALSPSTLRVTLGQSGGTLSATLSPAPAAPGVLSVTSMNPSVASVPASVAFAAGQSTVAMPVAGVGSGITTIHASANGGTASASVQVNAPPAVSLTAPANNALFNAPASFTVSAAVADADGKVTSVEFYQDTTLVGSSPTAPYAAPISNLGAGSYRFTAVAFDDAGAQTTSAVLNVAVNALPTISITGPIQGATFAAPASVPIVVSAADTDGSVRRVEVSANGSAITTLTAAPFSFTWTGVPAGNYILTAKIFDNNDAETVSAPVSISVTARAAALYFIHVDHLNTPRLVADSVGAPVWQWDQTEPFGNNPADENPKAFGNFELPLRLPGQYFDRETNLHYNYFRDYDPNIGRYIQSDPLGLQAGLNTYGYGQDPIMQTDIYGLQVNDRRIGGIPISGESAGNYAVRRSGVCGGDGGIKFPDEWVFFKATWNFRGPCSRHDDCYDKACKPRSKCDDDLQEDLGLQCQKIPPAAGFGFARSICRVQASQYYYAVVIGGAAYYNPSGKGCAECPK